MTDHSMMRLGKKKPRLDKRTLQMARYLKPTLAPPPDTYDNTKGITDWGMMLNDSLGDCTIAGCGHAIQVWTANLSSQVTVPDADIQKYYEQWDGYNPADPNTDQGGVEVDVLNNWRKNGLSGHQLLAFADPDPMDVTHVKQSVVLFGGTYIGLGLPLTAQDQDTWDVVIEGVFEKLRHKFAHDDPTQPNSWGGHCVFVPAYNTVGPICITWGQLKQMTWAFWQKYCDECHTLLSADWISAKNPTGFDVATLQSDLSTVVG